MLDCSALDKQAGILQFDSTTMVLPRQGLEVVPTHRITIVDRDRTFWTYLYGQANAACRSFDKRKGGGLAEHMHVVAMSLKAGESDFFGHGHGQGYRVSKSGDREFLITSLN